MYNWRHKKEPKWDEVSHHPYIEMQLTNKIVQYWKIKLNLKKDTWASEKLVDLPKVDCPEAANMRLKSKSCKSKAKWKE